MTAALADPRAALDQSAGEEMHRWMRDLFPVMRSLTGGGVRETLGYLQQLLPGLQTHAVASGTQALDWRVPDEWNVRQAYIENEAGERIVDIRNTNLHLLGYSEPVDTWLTRAELDRHLHSLPDMPDAIPYVTSYYSRHWGFCLTHRQRQALPEGRYHAVIDADLKPGLLNYADLVLPGETSREIMFSTYVCHPSMANNELSGPVVTAALARWLMQLEKRRHTYRFVFVPETIGAIIYLSKHLEHLKRHVAAGFIMTCMGDERAWSFMPSRKGGTLADRAALAVLEQRAPGFKHCSFLDRGSDERQYCAPGVDLPFVSVMRSRYGDYPEYHTSLDDLSLATPKGLGDSFAAMRETIQLIENNVIYRTVTLGEPQLGKRGLYPSLGNSESHALVKDMLNILAYADGGADLIALAEIIDVPPMRIREIAAPMLEAGVLEIAG